MSQPPAQRPPESTRDRLIGATIRLMLRQGYAATSIDQICADAGTTKGGFFHHFPSKDAATRAAVEAWGAIGAHVYSPAWDDTESDPLDRLHRFLDIMSGLNASPDEPCLCMVGMMSQELALTNPAMRDACAVQLTTWTSAVAAMLAQAKQRHTPTRDFDPEAVAWLLNSIWQGSMLIAKTRQSPQTAVANLALVRDYVDALFHRGPAPAPVTA